MPDIRQSSAPVAAPWQARAFGHALGDLDIDPLGTPRPAAVAGVLAQCLMQPGGGPRREQLLAWPVNRLLQALLAVTVATRGAGLVLTANCNAAGCGAPMDLPLDLEAFRGEAGPETASCALPDGRSLAVAVPTGADQLAWLAAGDGDPISIVGRLARLPEDLAETPAAWLAAVEAALEQADPLTTLELETVCPECGSEAAIPLDLEARCLSLLAAERPRLLDDIHALATAYHWSEAEILALPPERRRQYLARIERMWS